MDNVILFKTVHGSHLYNLAHENSDQDFYVVVDRGPMTKKYKYATQKIIDGIDTTTFDIGTWLRLCEKGVPQALEAMFSNMATVDELTALRSSYRVGFNSMRDTYVRTMENFVQAGDFKRKRHALRLWTNLGEASRHGRFNPTLSDVQVALVNSLATRLDDDAVLRLVKSNNFR